MGANRLEGPVTLCDSGGTRVCVCVRVDRWLSSPAERTVARLWADCGQETKGTVRTGERSWESGTSDLRAGCRRASSANTRWNQVLDTSTVGYARTSRGHGASQVVWVFARSLPVGDGLL
uniref:Uncharacterized protein n=1 Tax=Knipowitschia caucasica TaxID=637954 RepID=A0AAV2LJ47_KNICA